MRGDFRQFTPKPHLVTRWNRIVYQIADEYATWRRRKAQGRGHDRPFHERTELVGVLGEWGTRVILGYSDHAHSFLLPKNWQFKDGGLDFFGFDIKAVPYPDNPCLMIPQDRDPLSYSCEAFINAFVDFDLKLVGLAGWMRPVEVAEYDVRQEFCGRELPVPARCVPWYKQHDMDDVSLRIDNAAS